MQNHRSNDMVSGIYLKIRDRNETELAMIGYLLKVGTWSFDSPSVFFFFFLVTVVTIVNIVTINIVTTVSNFCLCLKFFYSEM